MRQRRELSSLYVGNDAISASSYLTIAEDSRGGLRRGWISNFPPREVNSFGLIGKAEEVCFTSTQDDRKEPCLRWYGRGPLGGPIGRVTWL